MSVSNETIKSLEKMLHDIRVEQRRQRNLMRDIYRICFTAHTDVVSPPSVALDIDDGELFDFERIKQNASLRAFNAAYGNRSIAASLCGVSSKTYSAILERAMSGGNNDG